MMTCQKNRAICSQTGEILALGEDFYTQMPHIRVKSAHGRSKKISSHFVKFAVDIKNQLWYNSLPGILRLMKGHSTMLVADATSQHAEAFLKPLCEETEKLLRRVDIQQFDRLSVELDKEGKNFIVRAFGYHPAKILSITPNPDKKAASRGTSLLVKVQTEEYGNASHAATQRWALRVPERKQIMSEGLGVWRMAATDMTAIILNHLWPKDQVIFDDDAKTVFDYLLVRFMQQTQSARERALFKLKKELPNFNFIDSASKPLAPYQKVALKGCIHQEGQSLFMEQGTGKTPVVIARVCNESRAEKYNDRMMRVLIVCPKNVRANWRSEFFQFATVAGKVTVLRGGQLQRMKDLVEAMTPEPDCRWSAIVCSYETVQRSWDALRIVEWDLTVLDESHYIKSASTKRFKHALKLRDLSDQRMCLTGTPITNTLLDMFTQLEFIGEGMSGFTTFNKFKEFYGRWVRRDQHNLLVGYKNVPFIQERLARCSFMIRKDEALPDLPAKVYDIVECSMSPEQAEIYIKVRDQLMVEIEDELNKSENKSLVINNILVKLLRLSQITSGFVAWNPVYNEEGEEVTPQRVDRLDPNNKIETLVELLKEKRPDQKTLIWACWVQDIKSIAARLRLEGIEAVTFYGGTKDDDRDEAVRRFNCDSDCKVFIGNPAAGGTGLNLRGYNPDDENSNTNCDHEIYFSQNWSMTARSQSEDRVHRRGTRVNVRITDLCIPGTIDEEIRARVLAKRMSAYEIQDVRNIMARVLDAMPQVNGD